ncbi:site-specific DNA-methyltransferase, partial [Escherichia coli]|nr:site-specific DNA-methyltransferase [Escherichia coli]
DRNPLQYKPVPVTEYILVYRKKTDKLIDWNIRNHHSKEDVFDSKIGDDYEKTNLWKINPSRNRKHPATFPYGLAE